MIPKLTFCIVFLCLIFFANSSWAQSSQEKHQAPFSCKLSLETQPWHLGQPAIISIELQDQAGKPLNLTVYPTATLEPTPEDKNWASFWSPIEIGPPGKTMKNSNVQRGGIGSIPVKLHFDKDQSLTFKVDANEAKWDRYSATRQPHLPLYKKVPSGNYYLSLWFLLKIDSEIDCNKVEVLIQPAGNAQPATTPNPSR